MKRLFAFAALACVVSHRRNEDGFEHIEGIAFAKSVTGKNNRVLAEAEGYKKTVQAPTFGEAGIFVAWGRKQPQLSTTLRVMAVRHADENPSYDTGDWRIILARGNEAEKVQVSDTTKLNNEQKACAVIFYFLKLQNKKF